MIEEIDRSRRNNIRSTLIWVSGTIVSVIGLLLPIIVFLYGRGIANRPHLIINQSQLSLNAITISNCFIKNSGRANAENVLIRIESAGELFNELEIVGTEDNWEIESGGIGFPTASVRLPRLVSTYSITLTASITPTAHTNASERFLCDVASDVGPGSSPTKAPVTFNWGDILVLIGINALVILVSWILHYLFFEPQRIKANFERNQVRLEMLHQELKQEILKKLDEQLTRGAQEHD